ncbi:hypothetical protein M9458_057603, partial [Cirrhinus mrigala]
VFTVVEAALFPLREQGIHILNYLNDWLILAQDLVLAHLSQLGLRVNWEKSKLSLMQGISFLDMELDLDGPTETILEAAAVYGSSSGSHTAGAAPYETASTLAPPPSPEEGVTPACRQTFTPWSPGMLWYTRMPPPSAGGPCTMGRQFQG